MDVSRAKSVPNSTNKSIVIKKPNGMISKSDNKMRIKGIKKQPKPIGIKHREFELTYDMMLGIRHAVSTSEQSIMSTKNKSKRNNSRRSFTNTFRSSNHGSNKSTNNNNNNNNNESDYDSDSDTEISLSSNDNIELEHEFLETHKYKFPSEGSHETPPHKMRPFKFKDYSPQIFRQLRDWFSISTQEYLMTICGNFNLLEFISNSKSGQFFFFSHNSQFIIKTMTKAESIFLRKIMPDYFMYIKNQPFTLLPKFYGMHRVKCKKQQIYFLIQQNVFYSDVNEIDKQFDLKGSTQGRKATQKEKEHGAILKDLDFIDEGITLKIGKEKAKLFKEQLKRDTEWLRKMKIMDYSLLVGIHHLNKKHSNSNINDTNSNHDENETKDDNKLSDVSERIIQDIVSPLNLPKTANSDDISNSRPSLKSLKSDEANEMMERHLADPNSLTPLSVPQLTPGITKFKGNDSNNNSNNDSIIESKSNKPLNILIEDELHNIKQTKSKNVKQKKSKPLPININAQSLPTKKVKNNIKTPKINTQWSGKYHSKIAVNKPKNYKRKRLDFSKYNIKTPDKIILKRRMSNIDENTENVKPVEIQVFNYENNLIKTVNSNNNINNNNENSYQISESNEHKLNNNNSNSTNDDDSEDINPFTNCRGGMAYEDNNGNIIGNEIYFCGIIDILQKYNKRKKLENWMKKMKYDNNTISAVPPNLYARRICDFFEDKII